MYRVRLGRDDVDEVVLELLGLAYREFLIIPNKSQRIIHA
jgi:hypothetical protein